MRDARWRHTTSAAVIFSRVCTTQPLAPQRGTAAGIAINCGNYSCTDLILATRTIAGRARAPGCVAPATSLIARVGEPVRITFCEWDISTLRAVDDVLRQRRCFSYAGRPKMSKIPPKQGAGGPRPESPAPQGAWRAPGAMYSERTARAPGACQAPSDRDRRGRRPGLQTESRQRAPRNLGGPGVAAGWPRFRILYLAIGSANGAIGGRAHLDAFARLFGPMSGVEVRGIPLPNIGSWGGGPEMAQARRRLAKSEGSAYNQPNRRAPRYIDRPIRAPISHTDLVTGLPGPGVDSMCRDSRPGIDGKHPVSGHPTGARFAEMGAHLAPGRRRPRCRASGGCPMGWFGQPAFARISK